MLALGGGVLQSSQLCVLCACEREREQAIRVVQRGSHFQALLERETESHVGQTGLEEHQGARAEAAKVVLPNVRKAMP